MKKKSYGILSNIGLDNDRNYFVENLSLLVASGMPITSVLDSILAEVKSKRMYAIILSIKEDVDNGFPLWKALQKTNLFKDHTLHLIRLGEESGKLVENLKVISVDQEKDRVFKSKIRSATMYPVFVLSVTMVVGISISWFILPKLAVVFSQLKLNLPLITKILIAFGLFLNNYGLYAVPLFILCIMAILYFVFFYSKTKFIGQKILFFVPGIKQLMKEAEIARFGYLLGTLLESGLPIDQSLESLASSTEFIGYRKFYTHIHDMVLDGESFQKSFASFRKTTEYIPTPIQELIIIAERSGNLSSTLLKIGLTYEAKTEITTKNLTVILEPILLVIVWIGVVAVALAVILPIYSLVGNLNNNT